MMNRSYLLVSALFAGAVSATPVRAEPPTPATTLTISPYRCVALHRGQACYLETKANWQSAAVGDYCLHRADEAAPLACWEAVRGGRHSLELEVRDDLRLELRPAGTDAVLAAATVEVAWVYNAPRRAKGSWRLF